MSGEHEHCPFCGDDICDMSHYQPRIHVVKSVPYIVGVVNSNWAEPYDCIYAAMAEAIRFTQRGRGSVEVDVDAKVVWSSHPHA